MVNVAAETSASSGVQIRRLDHDQAHPMGGDALVTASVIWGPLLSPMDSAHGYAMRLVEVRRRIVVLKFPVLNHKGMIRPEGVGRKASTAAVLARITQEPIERVLP